MEEKKINNLILSIFPGIDILGRAFEEEGWCIVRGPDLLWGGDIKRFHPPEDIFEGIIGGPPCQCHSVFSAVNKKRGNKIAEDLIPEFIRVVEEAKPSWFLMENVPAAPIPKIKDYNVISHVINNRWLGEKQNRKRRFSVGYKREFINKNFITLLDGEWIKYMSWGFENPEFAHCVRAKGWVKPGLEGKRGLQFRRHFGFRSNAQLKKALPLMGLPEDFFDHSPFTMQMKWVVLGNGVPMPMGLAIARAIKKVVKERI